MFFLLLFIVCALIIYLVKKVTGYEKLEKDKAEFEEAKITWRKNFEAAETQKLREIEELKKAKLRKVSLESAKWYQKYKNILDTTADENLQSSPYMAEQIADFFKLYDDKLAYRLNNKARPAKSARDSVKVISEEKRELQKKLKMAEYQIAFWESCFPWLEEFKEVPAKAAWEYAHAEDIEYQDEYSSVKDWISPEEFQTLSSAEKNQLILDRYNKRKKTDWEVGIEYERYVGYILEEQGYVVSYTGAKNGLQDMGRDLIAKAPDGTIHVIQCKRWSKEKTIHEKHIFQLFGTTMLLRINNPKKNYIAVFYTSTTLSDTAKKCADALDISVVERFEYQPYPMIKCNVNQDGQKIYHLPMDQRYDVVQISGKKEACYLSSTQEAEAAGFRRAYRWRPDRS